MSVHFGSLRRVSLLKACALRLTQRVTRNFYVLEWLAKDFVDLAHDAVEGNTLDGARSVAPADRPPG